MVNEIEQEIEKLQIKKIEIVNKINSNILSLEEKEENEKYLDIIQRQISILEVMKQKRVSGIFSQ
ncbi:MAG: hypothetical protein HYW22_01635 [Candidatus Aenigmarchaeota archaeon]|nr:hypothetical protein [Candidatus Aenigmarchaeota archaeon]